MRTIIAAILLMSVAATANAQASPDGEAACKANHNGSLLLTTAQFTNGYKVEAPWRVLTVTTQTRRARVTAKLDYIVETDPVTGKRQRTPLPGPIEMTFNGETSGTMLEHAADVWCATVAKALAARSVDSMSRVAQNRVIM
jgi:hypothetical protein